MPSSINWAQFPRNYQKSRMGEDAIAGAEKFWNTLWKQALKEDYASQATVSVLHSLYQGQSPNRDYLRGVYQYGNAGMRQAVEQAMYDSQQPIPQFSTTAVAGPLAGPPAWEDVASGGYQNYAEWFMSLPYEKRANTPTTQLIGEFNKQRYPTTWQTRPGLVGTQYEEQVAQKPQVAFNNPLSQFAATSVTTPAPQVTAMQYTAESAMEELGISIPDGWTMNVNSQGMAVRSNTGETFTDFDQDGEWDTMTDATGKTWTREQWVSLQGSLQYEASMAEAAQSEQIRKAQEAVAKFENALSPLFPKDMLDQMVSFAASNPDDFIDYMVKYNREMFVDQTEGARWGVAPEIKAVIQAVYPDASDLQIQWLFMSEDQRERFLSGIIETDWTKESMSAVQAAQQTLREVGFSEDEVDQWVRGLAEARNVRAEALTQQRVDEAAVEKAGLLGPFVEMQQTLGDVGQSFVAGVGDVLSATGGALQWIDEQTWLPGQELGNLISPEGESVAERWLGEGGIGAALSRSGEKLQSFAPADTLGDFQWGHLFMPQFYATKVARTVPFTLSLVPTAVLGAYAAGPIGTALSLGNYGRYIITAVLGGTGMRLAESAMEAGGTFDEAIKRGMSREEATAASNSVFWKNVNITGLLDAAQLATAFAPTPVKLSSGLFRTATFGAKLVIVGLSEAGEEYYQEAVQRIALGDEVVWGPEMQQVMAIGGLMGVGMAGIGDAFTSINQDVKSRMTPEMKARFEQVVQDGIAEGMSEEYAELMALDALSSDPTFLGIVDMALQILEIDGWQREVKAGSEVDQVVADHILEQKKAAIEEQYAESLQAAQAEAQKGAPVEKAAEVQQEAGMPEAGVQGAVAEEAAPQAKEPWQMTREEFISTKADERTSAMRWEHTFGEGAPGLSIESPITATGEEFPNILAAVYRNEQGDVVGQYSFVIDPNTKELVTDPNQGAQSQVWVNPDYRRQGIASKLRKFAKDYGYDIGKIEGRDFTTEGAGFEHSVAVREAIAAGKPVPGEVLADYPDLQQQAPPPAVEKPKAEIEGVPEKATSARQDILARDRENLQLNPVPSQEKRAWNAALDQAKAENLPSKALDTATDLTRNPRPISDIETAGMVLRLAEVKAEHATLSQEISGLTNAAEIKTKAAQIERAEAEFDVISSALYASGSEKGRALNSQKLAIDEDMTLISVKARAKAKKGQALTEAETAKLKELVDKLQEATDKVQELEAKLKKTRARKYTKSAATRYAGATAQEKAAERQGSVDKIMEMLEKGCYA